MKTAIQNILYAKNRKDWRIWLSKNFDKLNEIWLVFPKKSSGKKRIPYNDAVEEALCFGWIDSTAKTLDEDNTIQRFTPRRPHSSYSQTNIERLKWLNGRSMLHPSVKAAITRVINEEFVFPDDILNAIKKDTSAWKNYNAFSLPYKRIRTAYIHSARHRPEEFKKRLNNFIEKTKKNKLIGYGGIDKYY